MNKKSNSGQLIKTLFCVSLLVSIISGCSYFQAENILPGERESIFASADYSQSLGKASLNKPTSVKAWLQAGGSASGSLGNISGNLDSLALTWKTSTGAGRPFASPLVLGNKVFALAGDFSLTAWTIGQNRPHWRTSLAASDEVGKLIGGGIASDGTFIYAITAFGEAMKVSIDNGNLIWRKNLQTALRGAPLVFDGKMIAVSSDGTIVALNTDNGDIAWQGEGIGESVGLVSLNSPVARGDMVVAALRSGEITGHNKSDGRYLWASGLGRGLPSTTMAVLSDVPSRPIIGRSMIFASTIAGETIGLDAKSGERIWRQRIGTAVPMSLSGNSLFVLGNNNVMFALDAKTGDVNWSTEIQAFGASNAAGFVIVDSIIWAPTGAGGIVGIDATSGKIIKTLQYPIVAAVPPLATGQGIFLYDTSGSLHLLK